MMSTQRHNHSRNISDTTSVLPQGSKLTLLNFAKLSPKLSAAAAAEPMAIEMPRGRVHCQCSRLVSLQQRPAAEATL